MVWIAPSYRRKGLLTPRWPHWRAQYGDSICATPWSEAFEHFLSKIGAPALQAGLVGRSTFVRQQQRLRVVGENSGTTEKD